MTLNPGRILSAWGIALLLILLAGCETTRPMTYRQWKAEQAKKMELHQLRQEAKEMRKTPVVFTKEEQAGAAGAEKR